MKLVKIDCPICHGSGGWEGEDDGPNRPGGWDMCDACEGSGKSEVTAAEYVGSSLREFHSDIYKECLVQLEHKAELLHLLQTPKALAKHLADLSLIILTENLKEEYKVYIK